MKAAKRRIGVEAMAGMTREQVRFTNDAANALITKFHVCEACAIKLAVAMAWTQVGGPKKRKKHLRCHPCSEACIDAMHEFCQWYFGSEGEIVPIEQMPSRLS